jgi:hypothetical protein
LCAALANERQEPGGRVADSSIRFQSHSVSSTSCDSPARHFLTLQEKTLHCSRKSKPGSYIKTYSVPGRGLERLEAAFFKPLA